MTNNLGLLVPTSSPALITGEETTPALNSGGLDLTNPLLKSSIPGNGGPLSDPSLPLPINSQPIDSLAQSLSQGSTLAPASASAAPTAASETNPEADALTGQPEIEITAAASAASGPEAIIASDPSQTFKGWGFTPTPRYNTL